MHLPDHGAQTKLAKYQIKTRNGWRTRTVSQPGDSNRWVKLGIFRTKGIVPEVKLNTITSDGTGTRTSPSTPWRSSPGTGTSYPISSSRRATPTRPTRCGRTRTGRSSRIPRHDAGGEQGALRRDGPRGHTPVREARLRHQEVRRPEVAAVQELQEWRRRGRRPAGVVVRRPHRLRLHHHAPRRLQQAGRRDQVGPQRRDGGDGRLRGSRGDPAGEQGRVPRADVHEPAVLDASLGTVSLDYWDAICTPDCDEAYQGTWDGLTVWEPVVDTHWASATRTFTWNNAVSGTSQKFDRGTFLNFKAAAPRRPERPRPSSRPGLSGERSNVTTASP